MPPITPVPIARWLAEPAPVASTSGSTPRMNAIEVMMIGRKRRCAACQRRLDHALALRLQVLGELDDQDRVLGRQADDGDQADLEVHVVGIAAQQRAPAARRARPAAPPGSPTSGIDQLSYSAARHRNTASMREAVAGSAPARRTAFPRATGRSTRSRSPAAAARPGAPSRPSRRRCCSPARRRPRCASPGSRCSARSASAPLTQRVVAKADSGTGWPWLLLAFRRSRSSGCMRAGASACTTTRCRRPRFGKSLT